MGPGELIVFLLLTAGLVWSVVRTSRKSDANRGGLVMGLVILAIAVGMIVGAAVWPS